MNLDNTLFLPAESIPELNAVDDWRAIVQHVMYTATLQESENRYGTDSPPFNYRWEHVRAVVQLACRLAEQTGADADIVEAAAWLHDVAKDTSGQRHPQEGAKIARRLLIQTNFPPEKIKAVGRVIGSHMGLWRDKPLKNLEAAVLWDADKLAKIGLTAAFHWLGIWLTKTDDPLATEDFIRNGRKEDWQAKTVASMHTKPAQKAAKRRLKRYQALWDNLEAELRGDDLL